MARDADQIAQDHAAMLGSVSVINSVIATHAKGSDATDEDFGYDMRLIEAQIKRKRDIERDNVWRTWYEYS